MIRPPVVAGSFYNLDAEMLKKQIGSCYKHKLGPEMMKKQKFIAAIVPHAGYEYSGPVAAWVYSRIEQANYIIIGPNHSGMGSNFAVMKRGLWKTPLGSIAIDEAAAQKLLDECKLLEYDVIAHQHEHSVEVQLPFLQHRFGNDFKLIPIAILNEFADDTLLDACNLVGKAISNMVKNMEGRWILLAASDFSHFIPHQKAKKIDNDIIKSILKLNNKEMFAKIADKNATICGYGAIAAVVAAAKKLGAKKAELLKYATSGDTTKDLTSVVGYASIIMV